MPLPSVVRRDHTIFKDLSQHKMSGFVVSGQVIGSVNNQPQVRGVGIVTGVVTSGNSAFIVPSLPIPGIPQDPNEDPLQARLAAIQNEKLAEMREYTQKLAESWEMTPKIVYDTLFTLHFNVNLTRVLKYAFALAIAISGVAVTQICSPLGCEIVILVHFFFLTLEILLPTVQFELFHGRDPVPVKTLYMPPLTIITISEERKYFTFPFKGVNYKVYEDCSDEKEKVNFDGKWISELTLAENFLEHQTILRASGHYKGVLIKPTEFNHFERAIDIQRIHNLKVNAAAIERAKIFELLLAQFMANYEKYRVIMTLRSDNRIWFYGGKRVIHKVIYGLSLLAFVVGFAYIATCHQTPICNFVSTPAFVIDIYVEFQIYTILHKEIKFEAGRDRVVLSTTLEAKGFTIDEEKEKEKDKQKKKLGFANQA